MRYTKFFSMIIILLYLVACSGAPQQPATIPPTTKGSPIALPSTWTPTAYVPPSETPIRPATLTFTPLPSVTPLPPTVTPSSTSNVPTPIVTPTITPTLVSDCLFWALEEGVFIHSVPFDESYSLLPTMIPSVTYQAVTNHTTYYELILDGETIGWVDYRLQSVWNEGPGCSDLPFDDREMTEFSSLCFFTSNHRDVQAYSDSALTEVSDMLSGTDYHRILLRYKDVYYSKNGMGAPNNYVDASQVRIFGNCENIPKAGITVTDSDLWSRPDGLLGVQVSSLPVDSEIAIQVGPVIGARPPGTSESGHWYLVLGPGPRDGALYGWIWSTNFDFE